MTKLGLVDLEILFLGIKGNGNFNENDIENSELKRLGVGRILDSLASLKDRKMIELNKDGTFKITDLSRHTLWNDKIPLWIRIMKILEIKSFTNEEISRYLQKSEKQVFDEIEKLRKNNLVLMSPQRIDSKIIRVFEILPDGIEKLKKIETEGYEKEKITEINPTTDIISVLNQLIKEINDLEIKNEKKEKIISEINQIKEKMSYFE